MKDDRKLWERPWSLKELRGATESWTLAADAGVSDCVVCVHVCVLCKCAVFAYVEVTQFNYL